MILIIWHCDFHYSDLKLPSGAIETAISKKFAIAGYKIDAAAEQLRQPRIVRIGAIQNCTILPTHASISDQVCLLQVLFEDACHCICFLA